MNNFDQVCPTGCIADVTHPNAPEPCEDECCAFCGAYLDNDGSCEKCGGTVCDAEVI